MEALHRITDHVLVWTSAWCTTTSTVVLGPDDTCLLVDPGVTPEDLQQLCGLLAARHLVVVAGFATHPHWDHLLWAKELGDNPRWATPTCASVADQRQDHIRAQVAAQAPGNDPDLLGRLTPLPPRATALPWHGPQVEVVEHGAHAPGHAGLHIVDDGVLVAGDMCSDIEIPLLDRDDPDALHTYHQALDRYAALDGITHVVPGHGTVGHTGALDQRIAMDRRYLDALSSGSGDEDPRLTRDWLVRDHRAQVAQVAGKRV